MNILRTTFSLCLALAAKLALAAPLAISAPNVVPLSAQLVTSGQPTAASLATLAEQGFGAVIYLAPPDVDDAVREEGLIVGRQGLVFVNIPILFNKPTEADFNTFAAVLKSLEGRKVLVHCQVNMRASSMSFLYRTIVLREDPKQAYEEVAKVWAPRGPWKQLIIDQLQKNQISFEPY
jgi:protein tyrosine phosphatase (PTP) superfamily phosphohydrolase (DUF442 family)